MDPYFDTNEGWDRIEEKEMEQTIKQLAQALAVHDWYFHYSDDYGVVRRGYASFDKIKSLCAALGKDQSREVWDEACAAKVIPTDCQGMFPL